MEMFSFHCIVAPLPHRGQKDFRLFSAWAEDPDSTEASLSQAGGQSKSVYHNFEIRSKNMAIYVEKKKTLQKNE